MADAASRGTSRRRPPENLTKLNGMPTIGRSVLVNQFSKTVDKLSETTNFPKLNAFLPANLWSWIWNYLKYAFSRRYPFPSYTGGKTGVYSLAAAPESTEVKIAIAGDWGTGTQEAQTIANLMFGTSPDLTIHLGDVYYVGDESEIAENCFGKEGGGFQGVTWRHGLRGSFALNGNHEMYANGKPYFITLLSSLGMPSGSGQLTSYFCLETESWRIIGIDTGYNSIGIPLLSQIPGINSIPAIGGDCHLEKSLLEWLSGTVKPRSNPKATLLLSHHQYYTAFSDHAYTKPAKQLMDQFSGQDVVWMWGHEHRLGIYDKFATGGGINAYGRCLGHGGMPVDLGTPDAKKAPLQLYDPRTRNLSDGTAVGVNGFVNLTIAGTVLTLDYRDIDNTQLLVETFTATGGGGFTQVVAKNPGILRAP